MLEAALRHPAPENQITYATLPGNLVELAELAGITEEEYGKENPEAGRERELVTPHGRITSECWYETLRLGDAQLYARWNSRFVAGGVAIS